MNKSIIEKLEIHKAPYSVEHLDFDEHRIIARSEQPGYNGPCSIAEVYRHENALLFAAAPEMLEALIGHVYTYYQCYLEGDIGFDCIEHDIYIIEKATGRTWTEIKEML